MSFFYRRVAPSLFPSILWHTDDSCIHLTFDDGPHLKATPAVLDILRSRNLKATFFLLGENVRRYPELVHDIDREGHAIGNHGVRHASFMFQSFAWQTHQIEEANTIISHAIGKMPQLFRPPFGRFNFQTSRAAASQGLRTVMWDVDSKDYSTANVRAICGRVFRQTQTGSIVLLHDNDATLPHLANYLNPILDEFQQRNLKLCPLVL